MKHLKKYVWQFFGYYLMYYTIFMAIIFIIDNKFNVNVNDFPIVIALAIILPKPISHKFIKNENRYFDAEELKYMIRKAIRIAFGISILPILFFFGIIMSIRAFLFMTEASVSDFLAATNQIQDPLVSLFLNLQLKYLLLIFIAILFIYYFMNKYLIKEAFNKFSIKYAKSVAIAENP